jgi:cytochrome b
MTTDTLSSAIPRPASRRVVDATTRMLHWLMAFCFTGAYLTADGERWRLVHVTLGYTLAGLLVARVLWGLFGPRPARLSVLARKLKGWSSWQNVAMALAVTLILGLIAPLTLSGYAVWDEWGGEWLEEVHEWFGNALLAVVLAHIGLIGLLSLLRRKNQALPMLTGRTPGPGPDLTKRNHGVLSMAILAGVVAFWAWQWTQAPAIPAASSSAMGERAHDHDDD